MSVYLKCKADNATFGVEAFTSAAKPYLAMNYTTQTGINSDQTTVSKAYIPLTTDTRVAGTKKIPVVYTTQTGVESSQTESKKLYIVQKTNVDTVTLTSYSGTITYIGSTFDSNYVLTSTGHGCETYSMEYSREWSATTRLIPIDGYNNYSSTGTVVDSLGDTYSLLGFSRSKITLNSQEQYSVYISTISSYIESTYTFGSYAPGRGGIIFVPSVLQKEESNLNTIWYSNEVYSYHGNQLSPFGETITDLPGYISHSTSSLQNQSNKVVSKTRSYIFRTSLYTYDYTFELSGSKIGTITKSVYSNSSNEYCPDRYTFTTTTL